ncbi:precorrin-6B methylase 2 [Nakamurella flavida]|uniref:class I SAM-dependent methyltransferase n=1 Tax=Nakamurella flavida TaxID=363630 RepID=UPI0027810C39|nr:class I SAM-dependent methyltransferase [Nakamurella flavida]MDP9778436.1 precorrin-6B methylase 2 [Nakamurella flavida]
MTDPRALAQHDRASAGPPVHPLDRAAAAVADGLGLTSQDVVLHLGCGEGELTLALAGTVQGVIAMDASADVLARARATGDAAGIDTVTWIRGTHTDVPVLSRMLDGDPLGGVLVSGGVPMSDVPRLLAAVTGLLRPRGGVAFTGAAARDPRRSAELLAVNGFDTVPVPDDVDGVVVGVLR